jgi:hypothetical protein
VVLQVQQEHQERLRLQELAEHQVQVVLRVLQVLQELAELQVHQVQVVLRVLQD